jgi:hypothetical protein
MSDLDWLYRRSQEAARKLESLLDWQRESLLAQALRLGRSNATSSDMQAPEQDPSNKATAVSSR